MKTPDLQIPRSLLLHPTLTPAAKLLWMILCLHAPQGPSRLAALSGLARVTVLRALHPLAEAGWCTVGPKHRTEARNHPGPEQTASIPADLLLDRVVGIRGKLLYGILQLTQFRIDSGQFTFSLLSELGGCSINAMKRAVRDLAQTGWVRTTQKNRLAPIHFTLENPVSLHAKAEVQRAKQRLDKAPYRGEALMREYLSLLVESNHARDNHYPHFLRNPWTDDVLQLDRYYPLGVAFEFNGTQHYRTTKRYPSKPDLALRWARDSLKMGLCWKQGVQLVIVHTADLSLEGMRQKVANSLPLRDLAPHGALIEYLESRSAEYRSTVGTGQQWTLV